MAKRVAVLGAGASGIVAIKSCLDEGLDVVCFERTSQIGGLWNYTEDVREGQVCVLCDLSYKGPVHTYVTGMRFVISVPGSHSHVQFLPEFASNFFFFCVRIWTNSQVSDYF